MAQTHTRIVLAGDISLIVDVSIEDLLKYVEEAHKAGTRWLKVTTTSSRLDDQSHDHLINLDNVLYIRATRED